MNGIRGLSLQNRIRGLSLQKGREGDGGEGRSQARREQWAQGETQKIVQPKFAPPRGTIKEARGRDSDKMPGVRFAEL
jgi:hypothetical protein